MGRRRRRKRRLKEGNSRREARLERIVDVRVERRPSSKKSTKVTRIRRRDGEVTEERYEL